MKYFKQILHCLSDNKKLVIAIAAFLTTVTPYATRFVESRMMNVSYESVEFAKEQQRLWEQNMDCLTRSAEKVQVEAAIALGQFALLAAVNKLSPPRGEAIYSNLLAVIEDINVAEDVRRRCLEAIAPLDSPRVKQIIEQAYHSNDGETKASAICAMGRNCDPVWLSIMSEERYSKDPIIRRKVAEACGELCREEAIPFLIDLAWDEEPEVREVSVRALGLIGGERAEGALKNLGDSPYQGVSQLARDTLEEMEKFAGFFDI